MDFPSFLIFEKLWINLILYIKKTFLNPFLFIGDFCTDITRLFMLYRTQLYSFVWAPDLTLVHKVAVSVITPCEEIWECLEMRYLCSHMESFMGEQTQISTYGKESLGWISLFKLVTLNFFGKYLETSIFFGKIDPSMNSGRRRAGDS